MTKKTTEKFSGPLLLSETMAFCLARMGVDFSKPVSKVDLKLAEKMLPDIVVKSTTIDDIIESANDMKIRRLSKVKARKVLEKMDRDDDMSHEALEIYLEAVA